MKRKKILATSGLVFVLLAAGPYFVITQNEFYRFSDEKPESDHQKIAISHMVSSITAARDNTALGSMSIKIDLSYHREMKEDETREIKIEYDATISRTDTNGRIDTIRQPSTTSFSIKLSSSAFTIAPEKKITKKEGTDFPTQFLWTITPQQSGSHLLIIDLTEVLSIEYMENPAFFELFTINGNSEDLIKSRTQTLPVKVYTPLGISKAASSWIMYLGGLIGFVLMYPLFIDWVKNSAFSR